MKAKAAMRRQAQSGGRLCLVFLLIVSAVAFPSCSMVKGQSAAEKAVARVHAQYDAGQFHEIYVQAAEELRKAATESEFTNLMTAIQQKLGKVRSTRKSGFKVNTNLSDTYVTITYETEFEQGNGTEQFTWRISGDHAALLHYDIGSSALLRSLPDVQTGAKDGQTANRTIGSLAPIGSTENRGVLPLQKALLGHWISKDGKAEIYFAEDEFIIAANQQVFSGKYSIESSSEAESRMKIRVNSDHFRLLTFSPDKRTLSDLVDSRAGAEAESFNWVFKDDKRQP